MRALILVSQLCEVVSSAAANDASSNYDNLFIHPREENKILKTKDLLTSIIFSLKTCVNESKI